MSNAPLALAKLFREVSQHTHRCDLKVIVCTSIRGLLSNRHTLSLSSEAIRLRALISLEGQGDFFFHYHGNL